MTPGPRSALAIILTQAWVIGAVPGTFAGLLLTALIEREAVDGIGLFSLLIAFVALLIAAVPFALGLALALAAPRFVLRWRTPLCVAVPVLATMGWAVLSGTAHGNRGLLALAAVDAAFAAAWVWWRTRALLPATPREMARVFE